MGKDSPCRPGWSIFALDFSRLLFIIDILVPYKTFFRQITYSKEATYLDSRSLSIAHEIHALNHLMMRSFLLQTRSAGLDEIAASCSWVLSYLYDHRGQDIFQKDIEAEFSISRSTVTNILQRLEGRGLVRRQSVGSDARLKKLMLTSAGMEAHLSIVPVRRMLDQQITAGISPVELSACHTTLRKLRGNLTKHLELQENQT